ncbi:tetratricopeptide repeat protein [Moorena producens JHB]|uniref:Tetratricopeptide repeat protein n=1 Tax=Moorena producens (strain JHB) TaxID=1454205 RepID=A0A1D9FWS6_MOOP1|nr:tetratricopeptide repeat protein [Moorena producens]AOY79765.1 tetratricopeptide repeat protein [Moorena producens JHB]
MEIFKQRQQPKKNNSQDANFYYFRGISHLVVGRFQAAILELNEAIEIDPNHAAAYDNRGICLRELGKHQEALANFQKSAAIYQKQGKTDDYQKIIAKIHHLYSR